jgi:arylsulfatase A-like enzyme
MRRCLRTGEAFALSFFAAGLVQAVLVIAPRTWVLEFQAGTPSTAREKLVAIAHSAAIEGLGFLCIGLFLALVAQGGARALPRWRAARASGSGAALVLASCAFFGWANLCWIAEDALPFLTWPAVLLLDVAGFLGFLLVLMAADLLVRRLPWSGRSSLSTALASALCLALATWAGLEIVRGASGGWREPGRLARALLPFLLALPVAGLLARLLAAPAERCAARLGRAPLLPRPLALALWALLGLVTLLSLPALQLSPLSGEPEYAALPEVRPRAEIAGPNVVLVVVDTLRADHLGCYGYPRPTSPFLDSLAAAGTRCADASAPAAWTKPSTGTILTGLYPSRHGALYHGSLLHLPEGERTLAEAFRERGYVTAGFVSNPNIKRVFDFDRGFDTFFDSPVEDTLTRSCIRGTWFGRLLMRLLRHQFNWNYENDIGRMNRHVLAWLERNHERRFFLYLHYIDPHIPYDPPPRYRQEFSRSHGLALFNRRKELMGLDLYDGEIRYTDDGLEELVGALERAGIWEDTLFVLTSDHGEEFFEHGVLGHGFSLYQEVVHVPLILHGPGVPAGRVLAEPVQLLDLPATMLALAGARVERFGDGKSFHRRILAAEEPAPEWHFLENEFGQNDSNQREFVLSGVRAGQFKLVLTEENAFFPPDRERDRGQALYHLATDPEERRNLFQEPERQALVQELLDRLRIHSRFLATEGFRNAAPVALSPDVEAGLRALGYGN